MNENKYIYLSIGIINLLVYIKAVLQQAGPILSSALFILAGIFYAIGQIMPYDKRARFQSTAINIIIGAIILAILSLTADSITNAAAHLILNTTNSSS
ncbi:MAG: hypothetical protein ARM1_0414 [Candidatus Micrarchaeota archaeon]|nr:MAG: hypothetical protein ARM1_0414 [Candidatus Micrarchaeota archaeon]